MTGEDRHPGGRPSKYDPSMCEVARKLCEGGAIDTTIAGALGIGLSTLYTWKAQFPEFREATKRGKAVADDMVEAALFRRATGYSFDSVKIVTVSQGAGAPSEVQHVPIVEHVPPDTTAGIFWLKNRRPADWRDKREVEHSGSIDTDPDFSDLDDDELAVMRLLAQKAERARRERLGGGAPEAESD